MEKLTLQPSGGPPLRVPRDVRRIAWMTLAGVIGIAVMVAFFVLLAQAF